MTALCGSQRNLPARVGELQDKNLHGLMGLPGGEKIAQVLHHIRKPGQNDSVRFAGSWTHHLSLCPG